MKRIIGVLSYGLFALLSMISLFVGVGEVIENLDGWHNFSSIHSIVFIIICLLFTTGAIINIISLTKKKLSITNIAIGILLIICPIIFHIICTFLQGNINSDFQYLMLRTFQGFDKTYILLIILSVISFPWIIIQKEWK